MVSQALLRTAEQIGNEAAIRDLLLAKPGVADIQAPKAINPFLAALAPGLVVMVTATVREANNLASELESLIPSDEIAIYPAWETLPHERLSPRADTVGERLATLRRIVHGPSPRVVVLPVRSLLQPQAKGLAELKPVSVSTGDVRSLDDLVRELSAAAYVRVDLVEHRGEFAVRGGIVDVFSVTDEHPVRIDFFGDTVDEMRNFEVSSQRSTNEVLEFVAPPCRELILTDEVRSRAAELAKSNSGLRELLEKISNGIAVEGMESLTPALVPEMELIVDVLPNESTIIVIEPERVNARAQELVATSAEFLQAAWGAVGTSQGSTPIDLESAAFHDLTDVQDRARSRGINWWQQSLIGLNNDPYEVEMTPAPEFRGDVERAATEILQWITGGHRVVITSPGEGQVQRAIEWLGEHEIPASLDPDSPTSVVNVTVANLEHGFVSDKLAVLTYEDLVGQHTVERTDRNIPSRRRTQIDPLELKSGDLVVHEQHGVGRYQELMRRSENGAESEYLVIEFAPGKRGHPPDRLLVPMDQLHQVSLYVGGENPSLDKLGGADWAARKNKARRAARKIAGELIALYAARQSSKGFAFSPDTPWQRELEDAFNYVETPDQVATIDEVKRDMEQPVPMDRLICGDVGFGKTEIAVRAAFKAIQDNKQVLLLVPTTLLVQQHYSTFAERFGQFPVVLRQLSRFQTEKQAKEVLAGLEDGSIDMVIGTHRLLQPGIKVKDLGLVIVDEEQRFGVEHKERLKQVRAAVDVLSMSATPIPRTLEMAITGIREMSTIMTPPENRYPVLSVVGPQDDQQIIAAIRRELLREGQVFYIHNRVKSINKAAEHLRELVPEARIAVAHGQMNEHALEQIMVDFWEQRFDILVCTTIVESGLDVSNANTMIVENAERMGLSQLHQLRGRVGRGRERAYAYFFYPPEAALSETAHDRLTTIALHNELGSGMAVAMKDLEIRGAGNLLGGEQSGHIADVGFDLYIRLVGEAVSEVRGEVRPDREIRLELPIDAHLPLEYVSSDRLRLELYRRLANANDVEEVDQIADELLDRFGELPKSAQRLLGIAKLRVKVRAAGLREVTISGGKVRFVGAQLAESAQMRLQRIYPGSVHKDQLVIVPRPAKNEITKDYVMGEELLAWIDKLLTTIFVV